MNKELSEHEKLKEICDKIGYEVNQHIKYVKEWKAFARFLIFENRVAETIDVREIIFTQEFTNKYDIYYYNILKKINTYWTWLEYELDNPVSYLYNLIK